MKIKQGMEQDYQKCINNNQDPYGMGVITFLQRWAELLEKDIDAGGDPQTVIVEKAEKYSHKADTEGITGFMYGCAVSILSHVWEYGEILRKWHNKEYGYDGEGCVNPAILTVGGE